MSNIYFSTRIFVRCRHTSNAKEGDLRLKVFFLALLLLSLGALNASAVNTDFESFPGGTPAASVIVPGVTFTSVSGNWQIYTGWTDVPLVVGSALGTFAGKLIMDFDAPQGSLQMGYRSLLLNNWTFFRSGNLVKTISVPDALPGSVQVVVPGGFDRVVIDTPDGYIIDNLLTTPFAPTVAIDPRGQFFLYGGSIDGCMTGGLNFQALDTVGNPSGDVISLVPCGTALGDIFGADLLQVGNTNQYWISFGSDDPTDARYLMKIDNAGNVTIPATAVIPASKVGGVTGSTAISADGNELNLWTFGTGNAVYRARISTSGLSLLSIKKTSLVAKSQSTLQSSQGTKRFLAIEQPSQVMRAYELKSSGLPDNTKWRLSPRTDGGHETGSVSADGLAAISNDLDSPNDRLYFQKLKSSGLPANNPTVVASGKITGCDVSSLIGSNRYVLYQTEDGRLFLQVITDAGAKLGAPILLH